jgi:hypothetical protein
VLERNGGEARLRLPGVLRPGLGSSGRVGRPDLGATRPVAGRCAKPRVPMGQFLLPLGYLAVFILFDPFTTLSGGSLGSCVEEERSKLR